VEAKTNFPGTRSSQINNGSSISATRLKLPLEDGKKGKDIFWYQKEKDPSHTLPNEDAIAQERAMAKQREEALMMEALGLKPKQPGTGTNAVNISRKEHGGGQSTTVRKDGDDVL